MVNSAIPSLDDISAAAAALDGRIVKTPTVNLSSDRIRSFLPDGADVTIKLELFQHAGSFKTRGALLGLDQLDTKARENGITAVSAGNHALAASWAAASENVSCKVIMPRHADPVRIEGCKTLGAEVILTDDVHLAFSKMQQIVEEEGRKVIHPYEGLNPTLGTATCGLEFISAHPDLEVVVIPVGGGGLISGMSRAIKLVKPECRVIGVEPFGADIFHRSFAAGKPVSIDKVDTIADSLGAPMALPYSFEIARKHVDALVRINDRAMLDAMAGLFNTLKIAAEPACAASTAAIMGPLREQLKGRKIGIIACGSNISMTRFNSLMTQQQMT